MQVVSPIVQLSLMMISILTFSAARREMKEPRLEAINLLGT